MFCFYIFGFHLPAIASRSGEAGGDETENTQSPSAKVNLLIGVEVIKGHYKIFQGKWCLLKKLIFRCKRIEFSHFHPGSEKE